MVFLAVSNRMRFAVCLAFSVCCIIVIIIYYDLQNVGDSILDGTLDRSSLKKSLTIEYLSLLFSQLTLHRDRSSGDGFASYEFNETASNAVGVFRLLPDTRNSQCQALRYSVDKLPGFSIIITYHNEAPSTLLRTIASVIQTTNPKLLEEIILIDDYSDNDFIGRMLLRFEKLTVERNLKREGLMRSRIKGAQKSKSDVLVFLDSHSECNVGWIEPLLQRLMMEPKAVISPVIDIIDAENFQYVQSAENLKGGFNWDMSFKWESLNEIEANIRKLNPVSSIKTPVIAGGIFAVTRQWFFESGSYDDEMDIWGAENIELSLRTWLCGGMLEILPCSRVAHVFRAAHPYKFEGRKSEIIARNARRVVDVWLVDYAIFFFEQQPEASNVDSGDVNGRLALQRKLRCKPFEWYRRNIYPELKLPIRQSDEFYVKIKNIDYCLGYDRRAYDDWEFKFVACDDLQTRQLWKLRNQNSTLTTPGNFCLSTTKHDSTKVSMAKCEGYASAQFDINDQVVKFKETGFCLSGDFRNSKIEFMNCSQMNSNSKVLVVDLLFI